MIVYDQDPQGEVRWRVNDGRWARISLSLVLEMMDHTERESEFRAIFWNEVRFSVEGSLREKVLVKGVGA